MTLTISERLSSPELLDSRAAWFARLEDLFAGGPAEQVFRMLGIMKYTEADGPDWYVWMDRSLAELGEDAERAADPRVFRPLILNYNPHGVHFIDHLLGAEVFQMEDASWQAHPLSAPIGSLQPPDLDHLPGWQVMKDFARAFLSRDVRGVIFALPTIASALNIALNLYGQEILAALYEDPDAARHDLRVINEVLCDIHRWYLAHIPPEQMQCIVPDGRCQPPGYGQLCGCSTQLLSPRLYRDFVAPLDAGLLAVYPHGGMIHLCGAHAQHIPTWRAMPELRSVQLNDRASEDLDLYFNGLHEDQVLYVHPCAGMPVERILDITGGKRLVLVSDS
ncbi:MAG: hypothetical protein EHM21_06015 [Chloroflexi bacterium]|nr:MAG: hypothetical protein EHM21_06015 [Chloroflexota bacterium]